MSSKFEAEAKAFEALMSDETVVGVYLTRRDIALFIIAMQFAVAHPMLAEQTRKTVRDLGHILQMHLAEAYPELNKLIEEDWLTPGSK